MTATSIHHGSIFSADSETAFRFIDDGALAIGDDGRIIEVGAFTDISARFPSAGVTDWDSAAILPGLVDAHSHIPQYSSVAMDGYELLPWLERFIYPAEAAFADAQHAFDRSKHFFQAALARGTTAASLYATVHEEATRQAFRAAEESGIRAFIGKVMMDQNAPSDLLEDTRESLAASARLCEEWHGAADGRLGYVFSPRFAVTCSNALLSEVAALAEACGALIQTHLAENATELQTVAKLFPGARSYTDVYADAGLLGPRTIVAHCLYLSPREWDLLADTNTRIAHCPSSNFFLSSGIMDLHEALKRDIVVGLGSDVGAGPTLSMFAEMSQACFASRARSAMAKATAARIEALREDFVDLDGGEDLHAKAVEQLELADPDCLVSPAHALYMATLAGAETLGLRDQIGSFEPGKWADFVVVDLRQVDPYFGQEERAADEILSQIVFRTAPHAVAATYVAGDRRA